jgi:hypothetical protein
MRDLERAKQLLDEKKLSLVIVKKEKELFESDSSGIGGLLQAIERLGEQMRGAAVADRVVGRAAALLLVFSDVSTVYADTLSKEGLNVFEKASIPVEHAELVPLILNRVGDDICPFEKFSLGIKSSDEAYEQLKSFAESLEKTEQ